MMSFLPLSMEEISYTMAEKLLNSQIYHYSMKHIVGLSSLTLSRLAMERVRWSNTRAISGSSALVLASDISLSLLVDIDNCRLSLVLMKYDHQADYMFDSRDTLHHLHPIHDMASRWLPSIICSIIYHNHTITSSSGLNGWRAP
jgi:hypothetical protein